MSVVDELAALVHASYVAAKHAQGVTSVPSRHGTGDLMRPYAELPDVDREDDRRTVRTILHGLARMPWVELFDLLLGLRESGPVPAARATEVDPPAAAFVDRCVELAVGEDGQP